MPRISSLLSKNEYNKLRYIDNYDSIIRLSAVLTLYFLFLYFSYKSEYIALSTLLIFLCGFLLVCLFSAFHDTVHHTLLKDKNTNVWAGRIFGIILLNSYTFYRCYHLTHHKLTGVHGDTEEHGQYSTVLEYLRDLFIPFFMIDVWKKLALSIFGRFPEFVTADGDKKSMRIEAIFLTAWIFFVTVFFVNNPAFLLKIYVGPYIAYLFWFYFTALPEHYGCEESIDYAKNTRTTISNDIFSFLYFNGNYHVEHHIAPAIPSRSLPSLHHRTKPYLENRTCGYLNFHIQLVRNLIKNGKSNKKNSGRGTRIIE